MSEERAPGAIPRGTTPLHRALAAALREIAEREALTTRRQSGMSWIRIKWDPWHLEDRWSARAPHVSRARAACGKELDTVYVNFERSDDRPPLHQRCSDCQRIALQHGEGSS